jgi:hypothetical protein
MAAVKVTPRNDPPMPNKVTYGCYPSIPHVLRFTKGGKGLMHHSIYILGKELCQTAITLIQGI